MRKIIWKKFWRRDYAYSYAEACLRTFTSRLELEGFHSFKKMIFVREGGGFTLYGDSKEAAKFQREFIGRFSENLNAILECKKRFLRKGTEYFKAGEEIFKANLRNLSDRVLLGLLKAYYNELLDFTVYVWIVWNCSEYFSNLVTKFISDKAGQLKKENGMAQYLKYVSAPIKKSSILLLNEELDSYKLHRRRINFTKLYKKYVWLPWGDLQAEPWTIKHFREYVRNYQPVADENSIVDLNPAKDLNLNVREKNLIKINQQMAYLRDYRDEIRRRTVYLAHFLYKEIARRFKITYPDLLCYSILEIYDLFKGKKLSASEIQRRRGDTMIFIKNKKMMVLSGREMTELMKSIVSVDNLATKEVKGLIAYKGRVKGIAKIIKLNKELSKIKSGDIMIAVTTHPEYVPKMPLSAAIVTDEGGLTCHAAIIAREMKKPCIIGTKIATKVLKDGDLVEVDANRGVVKKIR